MRKIDRALLLLSLLFTPLFVSAANIATISEDVIVEDEISTFRYRDIPGIWQRSDIVTDQITALEKFNENIFITYEKDGQWVLVGTKEGLAYNKYWQQANKIKLKKFSTNLLGVINTNLIVISENFTSVEIDLPGHTYIDPENYIVSLSDSLLFFVERVGGIDVYDLVSSSTVPSWSYNCVSASIVLSPAPLIECSGEVFVFNPNPTQLLSDVNLVASSSKLSFWGSSVSDDYIVYDGTEKTVINLISVEPDDPFYVVSDRLFWQKAAGLFEVAWRSNPINEYELPESGSLRESDGGKLVVLDDSIKLFYSESFASWVEIDIYNSYEFLSTTNHLIAYLPEGSETFYEVSPGVFTVMDDSWAASSKIRTVKEISWGLLLVLKNSSNNPNIYKSTDYKNWTRITMPSNPTILTSIGKARDLPAGTLIELVGIITVLPGYVSSSISYLSDSIAGIQLYLSNTKGELNIPTYSEATIIGEISSSSIGRVLLDSPNHLILGEPAKLITPKETIIEMKKNIGLTYVIEGSVSEISSDTAIITDGTDSIKLHLEGVKELYMNSDIISVEVVVDYNSSSKNVEAWWTGEENKLVKREVEAVDEPKQEEKKVTPVKKTTSKPPAPAVKPAQPEPVKAAVATPIILDQEEVREVKVSGASSRQLPEWTTFLAGFLAGGLIIRGTRLKKILG